MTIDTLGLHPTIVRELESLVDKEKNIRDANNSLISGQAALDIVHHELDLPEQTVQHDWRGASATYEVQGALTDFIKRVAKVIRRFGYHLDPAYVTTNNGWSGGGSVTTHYINRIHQRLTIGFVIGEAATCEYVPDGYESVAKFKLVCDGDDVNVTL